MIQPTINYLAVLAAGVASMALGALWYSPVLFGKKWMELSGFTEKKMADAKKKGVGKSYAFGFLSALLMAYVLAHFIAYVEATTAVAGMTAGFWLWLGFIATVKLGGVLWEGKPWGLYVLDVAYYLVSLLIMGTILAVW